MKKSYFLIIILAMVFILENYSPEMFTSGNIFAIDFKKTEKTQNSDTIIAAKIPSTDTKAESPEKNNEKYEFPDFYRGMYLNVGSALNFNKLKKFVKLAKQSYINTLVLDVQSSRYKKCIVPKKHVQYCIDNGIHPIARVVVFPQGLKYYPVSKKEIMSKLDIAESACQNGFREVQFDYIRFNDSNRLKHLSLKKRYAFIEGFLSKAKNHLKKYEVKIAADIFGRIPLNRRDLIGQRMEGLDKVVDIICPMAYPSHYTWSKKLQHDPYYTVHKTSKAANKRTKNAEIVTYIQAFKMRLGKMPFGKYIKEQIRACHDAKIRGFIMWNARQKYDIPCSVTRSYYGTDISKAEENKKVSDM